MAQGLSITTQSMVEAQVEEIMAGNADISWNDAATEVNISVDVASLFQAYGSDAPRAWSVREKMLTEELVAYGLSSFAVESGEENGNAVYVVRACLADPAAAAPTQPLDAGAHLKETQVETMGSTIRQVGDQEFKALVAESGVPVVVDLWAPWCGPCRAVATILEEMAVSHAGYIHIIGIDADAHAETVKVLSAKSLPTVLVFAHGQEVARVSGAVSRSAIAGMIAEALDNN